MSQLKRGQDIPTLRYELDGNKKRHYPDFYIKKLNLLIEVKSTFTYSKYIDICTLKMQAGLDAGYNYLYMIFFNRGKFINKEEFLEKLKDIGYVF